MPDIVAFILLALLVVVLVPWILAAVAVRRSRRALRDLEELSQRLTPRISALEMTVAQLRREVAQARQAGGVAQQPQETARPAEAQPAVTARTTAEDLAAKFAQRLAEERAQEAAPAVPPVVAETQPRAAVPPQPAMPPVTASASQQSDIAGRGRPASMTPDLIAAGRGRPASMTPDLIAAGRGRPASSIPADLAGRGRPASTPAPAGKQRVGLEEKLGTNWLNKVGIVLLVLGVAFLLSTLMQTLGAAGKVLLGYAVSGALLGAGIWFEKREQYRVLARAGIGGGWALLFFTTYAMNHVTAAQVMSSASLNAVLMLIVAAAMVAHTLRYNSQVVTGLAFLLAFTTVTISTLDRVDVYSLTAGVVLALGVVAIALRRQWYELEVFGILATYGNHWLWLRPIIEPMGAQHHAFPEFRTSAVILVLYWLIFRVSYVARKVDDTALPDAAPREQVSTVAALLNTGLLLAVMKYQSLHPEWAAWFLLGLGAVELACGLISRSRRRMAFVVLATIGSALMVGAIPFHYSGTQLSLLWLLECETLFLAGIFTREIVFRRLGLLATLPVVLQLIVLDVQRFKVAPDPRFGMVFAFGALMFYFDAHVAERRWPELFEAEIDRSGLILVSLFASLLALLGCWVALPDAWIAVAWAVIGLALAMCGKQFDIELMRREANVFAAAALLRALLVNIDVEGRVGSVGLRLITLSCIAALLYLTAPWTSADGKTRRVSSAYTWAASFLVGLLLWYELQPLNVALAWAMFAVVLLETGIVLRRGELRLQAYAAFAAAFARVFFVNLNAVSTPGELSPRIYSTLPLAAALLYGYWRAESLPADQAHATERRIAAAPLLCYFGVITIAAVVRFELSLEWVVAGWAAMSLALTALAWSLGRRIFLEQALLMAAATAFRALFHNFSDASYFTAGTWSGRLASTGTAAALLFLCLPLAFTLRRQFATPFADSASPPAKAIRGVLHHPEQVLWFIPLMLITVLLALEMRRGMITVSWGVEGVLVFLLALWVGERSYRLSGLGLLMLCVGKIVVVDVWELSSTDRYLTFIVMGSALLLVSFLYSRYRDALRQYL